MDCEKRNECTKLCSEAEAYVNQDNIPQRELSVGFPIHGRLSREGMSKEEVIIKLYFLRRMTEAQIAETMGCTQQYISKIVLKYKGLLREHIRSVVVFRSFMGRKAMAFSPKEIFENFRDEVNEKADMVNLDNHHDDTEYEESDLLDRDDW